MTHQPNPPVDEQAAQWFVTLRDEDATAEDHINFANWLAESAENLEAWEGINRLWNGLGELEPAAPKESVRVVASQSIDATKPVQRSQWLRRLPLAACVVLGLGVASQFVPAGLMADYRTGVGERKVVTLDDGSSVELGTSSAIDVDFTTGQRTVHLIAGEAFFEVASNPERPFVVRTDQGQVKVLGTAFNVRMEDRVTVAVTHNTVEVSAAGEDGVKVTQGEMVQYDGSGVSAIEPADIDTIQAWRNDELVFKDAPLNEVLAELQRYRYGRIQLLSGTAGTKRVTAVFDARQTDAALDTIAESLGLSVYRATNLFVGLVEK